MANPIKALLPMVKRGDSKKPPETIVVDALTQGKRVLYVAQRKEQLQRVGRFLNEQGLQPLSITITDPNGVPGAAILDHLNRNRTTQQQRIEAKLPPSDYDVLFAPESSALLNQPIPPMNKSMKQMLQAFYEAQDFRLLAYLPPDPLNTTPEEYARLQKAAPVLGEVLTTFQKIRTCMEEARLLTPDGKQPEVSLALQELQTFLRQPELPAALLNPTTRKRARTLLQEILGELQEIEAAQAAPIEAKPKDDAAPEEPVLIDPHTPEILVTSCRKDLSVALQRLEHLDMGHYAEDANYMRLLADSDAANQTLLKLLDELEDQYNQVGRTLSISAGLERLEDAHKLNQLCTLLNTRTEPLHADWLRGGGLSRIRAQLDRVRGQLAQKAELQEQLSATWKPSILSVPRDVLSGMIENPDVNADTLENTRLSDDASKAQSLLTQVEPMQQAIAEAMTLLRMPGTDNLQLAQQLQRILTLLYSSHLTNARWLDVEGLRSILPLLNECETEATSLKTDREAILQDWQPDLFHLDVTGMRERAKGLFSTKLKQPDLNTLHSVYRRGGELPPQTQLLELLRRVEKLQKDIASVESKGMSLRYYFGSRFQSLDTDWSSLRKEINEAFSLPTFFRDNRIPNDTMRAMQLVIEDSSLANKAKNLAVKMSQNKISSLSAKLSNTLLLSQYEPDTSLGRDVMPQLREIVRRPGKWSALVEQLRLSLKTGSLSRQRISMLLVDLKSIDQVSAWFPQNRAVHEELFGHAFTEEDSDWDALNPGLAFAGEVASHFEGKALTDEMCRAIAGIDRTKLSPLNRSRLTSEHLDQIAALVRNIFPQGTAVEQLPLTRIRLQLLSRTRAASSITSIATQLDRYLWERTLNPRELLSALEQLEAQLERKKPTTQTLQKARSLFGIMDLLIEVKSRSPQQQLMQLLGLKPTDQEPNWRKFAGRLDTLEEYLSANRVVITDEILHRAMSDPSERSALEKIYTRLNSLHTTLPKNYRENYTCPGILALLFALQREEEIPADMLHTFECNFTLRWLAHAWAKHFPEEGKRLPAYLGRLHRLKTPEGQAEVMQLLQTKTYRHFQQSPSVVMHELLPQLQQAQKVKQSSGKDFSLKEVFHLVPALVSGTAPCMLLTQQAATHLLDNEVYRFDVIVLDGSAAFARKKPQPVWLEGGEVICLP